MLMSFTEIYPIKLLVANLILSYIPHMVQTIIII